jgi:hypothetical protein
MAGSLLATGAMKRCLHGNKQFRRRRAEAHDHQADDQFRDTVAGGDGDAAADQELAATEQEDGTGDEVGDIPDDRQCGLNPKFEGGKPSDGSGVLPVRHRRCGKPSSFRQALRARDPAETASCKPAKRRCGRMGALEKGGEEAIARVER